MPQFSREKIAAPETKEITPHIGATTESSKNHPDRNEDAVFVLKEKNVAGVFDGMGGGLAGGEASGMAAKIISKELTGVRKKADPKEWGLMIRKSMEKAQEEITRLGNKLLFERLGDPLIEKTYQNRSQKEIEKLMEKKDMSPTGTTASIVKLVEQPDGSADLVFGHAGDSRIYVLKTGGELKQVTKDQGALEEAVQNKYITREEADFIDQATNKEEIIEKFGPERGATVAFLYKDLRRGVKSALGLSGSEFKTGVEHLEPGDRAIVTSDGIHDNLTNEEIRQEIMKGGTPAEISARLVEAAKNRVSEKTLRSKEDDRTAVVLEVPEVVLAAEAVEEPTVTPEQATKMKDDLGKLREMAEYLGKLLPMAKTMEKGLKPLTSKKRLEEIMGLGGARGVEDTLYTTESEILKAERDLAEHRGDVAAMQKITGQLRGLRETREKQLKARDQETIDQIKARVA